MRVKQSILEAKAEAKQLSIEHPNISYYVMDKHRGKAVCHSEKFIENRYFFYCLYSEGYFPYCKYKNGIEERS